MYSLFLIKSLVFKNTDGKVTRQIAHTNKASRQNPDMGYCSRELAQSPKKLTP